MGAVVQFEWGKYRIEDREWTQTDGEEMPGFVDVLHSMIDPDGHSGADPYPDLTIAEEAAKAYGGKVIEVDKVPDAPKDRVF